MEAMNSKDKVFEGVAECERALNTVKALPERGKETFVAMIETYKLGHADGYKLGYTDGCRTTMRQSAGTGGEA